MCAKILHRYFLSNRLNTFKDFIIMIMRVLFYFYFVDSFTEHFLCPLRITILTSHRRNDHNSFQRMLVELFDIGLISSSSPSSYLNKAKKRCRDENNNALPSIPHHFFCGSALVRVPFITYSTNDVIAGIYLFCYF